MVCKTIGVYVQTDWKVLHERTDRGNYACGNRRLGRLLDTLTIIQVGALIL